MDQYSTSDNSGGNDQALPAFKCVMLGDAYVGKTSLVQRFVTQKWHQVLAPTQGGDFFGKTVEFLDDNGQVKKARLQIWDTAGGEKFRSLTPMYFKDARAICLCYDSTDKETFEALTYWQEQIQQHQGTQDTFEIFLIATKVDMCEKEAVSIKQAYKMAKELNADLHQTSALSGIGIDQLFQAVGKKMQKYKELQIKQLQKPQKQQAGRTQTFGTKQKRKSSQILGDDEVIITHSPNDRISNRQMLKGSFKLGDNPNYNNDEFDESQEINQPLGNSVRSFKTNQSDTTFMGGKKKSSCCTIF